MFLATLTFVPIVSKKRQIAFKSYPMDAVFMPVRHTWLVPYSHA